MYMLRKETGAGSGTGREDARGMGGGARAVQRVRRHHVEWVTDRLSARDWRIVDLTNHVRLLSGEQLERLCFAALQGHARSVVRGRVLRRLVRWHVLEVLPRRIGGAARGSAGAVFALGSAGARVLAERHAATTSTPRVRHPGAPTDRTIRHTLAVSELYVGLVEQARLQSVHIVSFAAEPASWWPNGLGGFLKPDAYVLLATSTVREHWWIEVDLATESLPTIRRKLLTYLDVLERGQLGPHNVIPRVLVSAITAQRRKAIQTVVAGLPDPAPSLFVVVLASDAPADLLHSLCS